MPTEKTEAAVLAHLVDWSTDCPAWQRDALRRLCVNDTLKSTDIDVLLSICKGDSTAEPLTADHVRDPAAGQSIVTLKGLHSVQHVNALAANERLPFAKIGITVIYGDNGSGKSGYVRVLKKMCRARAGSRAESILPNIYEANPDVPSAKMDFSINGENKIADWTLGQPADPLLSAISVFDSRTANVHVDQANDVAYTPFPLKILSALAQVCQMLKEKLNSEIKEIQDQTPIAIKKPAYQPYTRVGKLLTGLNASTEPEAVKSLATLSQAEMARLDQLNGDLATDPARKARQLLALKTKVEEFITQLDTLVEAITDDLRQELRTKAKEYHTMRLAAQAASNALFEDEPLPYIGSDVWRTLWEAARAYSEREAYPDRPFPMTDHPAICVLCQQDIQPETAARLNRFEAFIKDDSKQREEEAKTVYESALQRFHMARITLPDLKAIIRCIADDLNDANRANDIRRSTLSCLWRYRQIKRNHAREFEPAYHVAAAIPIDAMRLHVTALARRADGLTAEAGSEERKALIAERGELADRKWLRTVQDDVLAQINRFKQIAALQEALKNTATNKITTKSTQVAEILVTDTLRANFAKEVERLGIASLAIEIRQSGSTYGIPRFKVALIRKPDADVGEVLSEGEHRCVALAAFLAELATTDSKSAIIFDDPISSLDHMHREAVANRLVDEARQRQVIVFTHDIAFLFLLSEACESLDTKPNFVINSVSRGRENAGFCNSEPPFKARPLKNAISSIRTRLNNEKIHYEKGDQDNWGKTLRSLQDQLRTAWERAVEEAVSPVVKRLCNKVMTPGLVKITAITLEDCERMRDAFRRCSALLHSDAAGLNKPLPQPHQVEVEITALEEWVDSLRQRQKDINPI